MPGKGNSLKDLSPRKIWLAVGVLIVGLFFTFLASLYVKAEVETAAKNEFDFVCNEIRLNIADRLNRSALVLYSGSALFDASDIVSRSEWHVFTSALRIERQMPGTQGIGYAQIISPDQLDMHIQKIREEGFTDYQVMPEGKRGVYSSIIYLEPFSGRNLRAFGYDMFSEPIRRAAMEQARDENTAMLSGKVTLVQEMEQDVQAGVLMYVPVYRHGMPTETVDERRAAITGWVYSPFRMNDMMRGTLGNYELKQGERHIVVQIYDGEVSPETLLYDSRDEEDIAAGVSFPEVTRIIRSDFHGRIWSLKFSQLGGMYSIADYGSFWLVLIGGTSISLLLFGLSLSQLRTSHYLESIRMLAETDALTGVYNRRKILELAESEYIRAKRVRDPLTIMMVDLNFFKRINDTYGHSVGDRALRATAHAMSSTLRKDIDRVGRFGGDEFLIILPETRLDQIGPVITRLRSNVAGNTQQLAEDLSPITLSIGAVERNEATKSLDELIERADRAMYADKRLAKE